MSIESDDGTKLHCIDADALIGFSPPPAGGSGADGAVATGGGDTNPRAAASAATSAISTEIDTREGAPSALGATAASLAMPPAAVAGFSPCAAFEGNRPGYVFKFGDHGLGYYRDAAAHAAAHTALRIAPATATSGASRVVSAGSRRVFSL